MLVGLTLDTKPSEIYRALVESTAFGTRRIIEAHEAAGIEIRELKASGGLPERNPFLMQVFADVTGRPIQVASTSQASALGSAMLGAIAAGVSPSRMASKPMKEYVPDSERRTEYDRLYRAYTELHEAFQDGDLMSELKQLTRS